METSSNGAWPPGIIPCMSDVPVTISIFMPPLPTPGHNGVSLPSLQPPRAQDTPAWRDGAPAGFSDQVITDALTSGKLPTLPMPRFPPKDNGSNTQSTVLLGRQQLSV